MRSVGPTLLVFGPTIGIRAGSAISCARAHSGDAGPKPSGLMGVRPVCARVSSRSVVDLWVCGPCVGLVTGGLCGCGTPVSAEGGTNV